MLQAAARHLHVGAVVLVADGLHDADGHDRIVGARHLAVVLQPQFDGEPLAHLHPERDLLRGDGHAQHLRAVPLGGILGEAAPPASQFEDAHAREDADLPAHQVELGFLRLVERRGVLPVAAGVAEPPVQHGTIEIVPEVVVAFADLEGPARRLQVEQPGAEDVQPDLPVAFDSIIQPGEHDARRELIDGRAFPPAHHVAFTHREVRLPQQALEEPSGRGPGYPTDSFRSPRYRQSCSRSRTMVSDAVGGIPPSSSPGHIPASTFYVPSARQCGRSRNLCASGDDWLLGVLSYTVRQRGRRARWVMNRSRTRHGTRRRRQQWFWTRRSSTGCRGACMTTPSAGSRSPTRATSRAKGAIERPWPATSPLDEIKTEIRFLERWRNINNVHLAGGEPLIHPDIVDIVRFIRERGLNPVDHHQRPANDEGAAGRA